MPVQLHTSGEGDLRCHLQLANLPAALHARRLDHECIEHHTHIHLRHGHGSGYDQGRVKGQGKETGHLRYESMAVESINVHWCPEGRREIQGLRDQARAHLAECDDKLLRGDDRQRRVRVEYAKQQPTASLQREPEQEVGQPAQATQRHRV